MLQESLGTRHTGAPRFQDVFVTLTPRSDGTSAHEDPCRAIIPLLVSFVFIFAKRSGCRLEAHEFVTFPNVFCNHPFACHLCMSFCQTFGL